MGLMICCYCLEPCGPQGDGCCDKGLPERTYEEVQAALARHAYLYGPPPEVWIDHEYGECFSAWGTTISRQ